MSTPMNAGEDDCKALALAVWGFFNRSAELPAEVTICEGENEISFSWPLDIGRPGKRRVVHIHIGDPEIDAEGGGE